MNNTPLSLRLPLRSAAWLLAMLLLASCSGSPELERLAPDATILAFGDSLTHGTGAERGYPPRLAELTGRRVIERGVPGELSAEGRERLPGVLDEIDPDLLILCHGGNDFLQREPVADLKANLGAMIEAARRRDVPVLLVAVPAPGLFLDGAEVYEQVAADYDVALEADAVPAVLGDRSLKSDPVHPNAEGYARIARALQQRLEAAGAL